MKVLITGGNGFLGLAVVKKTLELTDYQIKCFIRSSKNLNELNQLQIQYSDRLEIQRGSLLNDQNCADAVCDVDMIYHLAAATGGAPAEMFLNSSVATDHLLKAVISSGRDIKVVFCSSFSVYGTANLPNNSIIDENTCLEAEPLKRDAYSLTKLYQEKLVREYFERFHLPVAVIRPGVIYGPGLTGISGRVGLNLFGLFLHLGGKNLLPLTYVDNCADAFVCVSKGADFQFDVYNAVDDDLMTSREFLRAYKKTVRKVFSLPINYHVMIFLSWLCEKYHSYSNGQLPDVFTRYKTASIWKGRQYTNVKLKSIGWTCRVSTKTGLKNYLTYMKDNLA